MNFLIAYVLVAVSGIVITSRTLIAYTECSLWLKTAVYLFFTAAWFAPMLIWNLQTLNIISVRWYNVLAKTGYFVFGFSFLLLAAILLRDLVWSVGYFLSGKSIAAPNNPEVLNKVNLITLGVLLVASIYSVFAAEKMPRVVHYEFSDKRIQQPLKVLVVSDLHITKMVSVEKVKNWVKYFNDLQPDVILLPGDIADDKYEDIKPQINSLKKLKAPRGIFYTIGNHEVYHNAFKWESVFAGLGWQVLHNSGAGIEQSGVYVAGVPDIGGFAVNIAQSVGEASDSEYRILLAHEPITALKIKDTKVDLLVAGHTHGGQIFPFNWLVKMGNAGFVCGEYQVRDTRMLISCGAGYWGPPMRLFAPSDVLLIELKPEIEE